MSRHQPALLGGLLIGILSSLPIINLCCCLWVICGGLLTVYLQQQRTPAPIETADAVVGGLIAGIVGALIVSVVAFLEFRLVGPVLQSMMENFRAQLEANPNMSGFNVTKVMDLMTGGGMQVLGALVRLPVYAIFGILGALLGTALFRTKPPVSPA